MEQYRKSPRAIFLDYDYGDFFVTICTRGMAHYFGKIENGEMILSDIGRFVENQLKRANEIVAEIEIPRFVVMPNHLHAIICVDAGGKDTEGDSDNLRNGRHPDTLFHENHGTKRIIPTLSRYICSLKGAVTKFAISRGLPFAWQPRYHDHLIRDNRDGNNISDYIENNVAKWQYDRYNK